MDIDLTNPPVWWSKPSTLELAHIQKEGRMGLSPTVRTMVAAHRQWDDLETLLTIVGGKRMTPEEKAAVVDITKRHKKYDVERKGDPQYAKE